MYIYIYMISFLTYLPYLSTSLLIPHIRRCCQTVSGNFFKTTLIKFLKFCPGLFLVMMLV